MSHLLCVNIAPGKGHTAIDVPYRPDVIISERPWLVKNIDLANSAILDQLVADDVLSQIEFATIKNMKCTNTLQVSTLLDVLLGKSEEDWETFKNCLCKHDHHKVVERIEYGCPPWCFLNERLSSDEDEDDPRMPLPFGFTNNPIPSMYMMEPQFDFVMFCTKADLEAANEYMKSMLHLLHTQGYLDASGCMFNDSSVFPMLSISGMDLAEELARRSSYVLFYITENFRVDIEEKSNEEDQVSSSFYTDSDKDSIIPVWTKPKTGFEHMSSNLQTNLGLEPWDVKNHSYKAVTFFTAPASVLKMSSKLKRFKAELVQYLGSRRGDPELIKYAQVIRGVIERQIKVQTEVKVKSSMKTELENLRAQTGFTTNGIVCEVFEDEFKNIHFDSPTKAGSVEEPRPGHEYKAMMTVGDHTFYAEPSDFDHIEQLGRGSCTGVHKMMHSLSKSIMAVKRVPVPNLRKLTAHRLQKLDEQLRMSSSPYVVQYYGVFYIEKNVWVCMEVMDTSLEKLFKKVHENGLTIPERVLGKVVLAVVKGLLYLRTQADHDPRNLKPSKILINESGEVKINHLWGSPFSVDYNAKAMMEGAKTYMAPEEIEYIPWYDRKSCVWSLGILMIEAAKGKFPYPACSSQFDLQEQIHNAEPPRLPTEGFSSDFQHFIAACLQKNRQDRPDFQQLLEHPFLQQYKEEDVDVAGYVRSIMGSSSGRTTSIPTETSSVSTTEESVP